MTEMKLSELAQMVGGELVGDGEAVVHGCASIESAGPHEVTFLANKKYEKHVAGSRAAAVIVPADYDGPTGPPAGEAGAEAGLIRCQDSYFAFRQAMVAFYGFREHPFEGIDPGANVDPSAELGEGARVSARATVCPNVKIGSNTALYPGVFVGPRCRIGRDCILYPNVTLYDGTVLHDRVTVHAGSSIGHDGFGYATHAGRHEKIPQVGWVELEDDVEIGACCAIDRATMGATIIGAGTKFSNLVAIGHGTRLGRHCLMVAQSGIAGSVMVGDYCVFGGQSGVVGHIRIGEGVRVAAQAGLTNDVPAGQEMGGSPAFPLPLIRRAWATLPRLPQMRSAILRLTREVNALKKRLRGDDAGSQGAPAGEED